MKDNNHAHSMLFEWVDSYLNMLHKWDYTVDTVLDWNRNQQDIDRHIDHWIENDLFDMLNSSFDSYMSNMELNILHIRNSMHTILRIEYEKQTS
jgi:hypothetical protein